MIERAIEIALEAHQGQKDKSGDSYILHPIRVMLQGENENEMICGILHDVVEDSDWTFEMLEEEGFSKDIIEALKLVTKKSENENYEDFISRVSTNPIAVKVKMNDLKDNMNILRLNDITDADEKRLKKYLKAYKKLKEIS